MIRAFTPRRFRAFRPPISLNIYLRPTHTSIRFFSQSPTEKYGALADRIAELQSRERQLSFAWITPRTLKKGLEGGILARLLSLPDLNLIGSRMFAPSDEMLEEYIQIHRELYPGKPFVPFVNYLESLKSHNNESRGYPNHMMLLLFEGPQARARLLDAIGSELPDPDDALVGRHIRGAYGFHVRDPTTGHVVEFEPGLVTAHTPSSNFSYLRLFAKYADTDAGTLIESSQWEECGMVMLKPDLFVRPSARPGHIMDALSSTGLTLVSTRLFSMSVNDARDFYGFLAPIFAKKLAPNVDEILRQRLGGAFKFPITDSEYEIMTSLLKHQYAQAEVDRIIHYISGIHPHPNMTERELARRGPGRLLALLYRGENAIEKIRTKLGATDPNASEMGTIRADFGRDVMRNGAHASDSIESLHRERFLVGFKDTISERRANAAKEGFRPSAFTTIINVWLGMAEDRGDADTTEASVEEVVDFPLPWAEAPSQPNPKIEF